MDESSVHLALRARALSLVVATTGSIAMAQTATGFTRSAGSFIDDGFLTGMEVTPAGFPSNVVGIVTIVAALSITVTGVRAAVAEAPGKTLTVGLPAILGLEGIPVTPIAGRPYLTEEFSPSTSVLRSLTASQGTMEDEGDYILTWYGIVSVANIPGVGVKALRKSVSALKDRYPAGLSFATSEGEVVHISSRVAPATGQVIPLTGWSALQLKIPWMVLSQNAVIP